MLHIRQENKKILPGLKNNQDAFGDGGGQAETRKTGQNTSQLIKDFRNVFPWVNIYPGAECARDQLPAIRKLILKSRISI